MRGAPPLRSAAFKEDEWGYLRGRRPLRQAILDESRERGLGEYLVAGLARGLEERQDGLGNLPSGTNPRYGCSITAGRHRRDISGAYASHIRSPGRLFPIFTRQAG